MNKRTIEERVAEQEQRLELAMQRVKQYKEQLKALENRKSENDRKQRTHMLIQAGAELSSLYEHTLTIDEIHKLVNHLRDEKNRGIFDISKTEEELPMLKIVENEIVEEENQENLFGGMFNF